MGDAPAATRLRLAGLGGRTLLFIAVLALAVAAGDRAGVRVDLSADRRFSLHPSLAERLRAQREPVELIAAWPNDDAGIALDADGLRGLDDALTAMARVGTRVSHRRLDPTREPHRVDEFSARHGRFAGPGIYVARGERARKIALHPGTPFSLQREVAGALIALDDPRPLVARLSQGHGELTPQALGDDGAGALQRALATAGFSVEPLPPDARPAADDVLVIAGPTAPFGRDLVALEDHLIDGGAALVLADDRCPRDLARALARRGVLLGPAIAKRLVEGDPAALGDDAAETLPSRLLVSRELHDSGSVDGSFPYYNLRLGGAGMLHPDHPATAQIARSGHMVVSPYTTLGVCATAESLDLPADGIAAALARLGTPPFAATTLARTAENDTGKVRRDQPLNGPPPPGAPAQGIAWALTYDADPRGARRQGARLSVWASRSIASDAWLGQERLANADLMVDCARWLAGRGPAEDIPPRELAAYQVVAEPGTLHLLLAALVAVGPSALVGIALIAWWERR